MTFTMGGLAFVPNVFWLLALRLLNGLFSGYIPNSTALIASQAPKNRSGYALGTLATGMIGGSLIGPLLGGMLAEGLGIRQVFLLVGFIFPLICNFLTVFLIKEDFKPVAKANAMSTQNSFHQLKTSKF